MSDLTNRQVVLRRRPTGLVRPGDTELVDGPVPELADGEALVRTTYIGVDAAVRTWLDDKPGYLPPVQIGEPIRAAGVGEVIATRCPAYAVGDILTMLPGSRSCRWCATTCSPPSSLASPTSWPCSVSTAPPGPPPISA